MNTPSTPANTFPLSLWQKRQAAMLYRWMSLDYLKQLKTLIGKLIQGADVLVDLSERQGRDALIANPRWGVRDTTTNWTTYAYPALEDFRKSTLRLIGWRANEIYCGTGAYQCAQMLEEFSSGWMTEDEEDRFKQQFEAIFSYASRIDEAAGAGGLRNLNDESMDWYWFDKREAEHFPRLPKFRVRTDIQGKNGKVPPKTGVYVPQDDPHGVLQFAWTGNSDGELDEVYTFSDVGLEALRAVGRRGFWRDEARMVAYVSEALRQGRLQPDCGIGVGQVTNLNRANLVLGGQANTKRPCNWLFVEMIDGEFDDTADDEEAAPAMRRPNVPAGQPCPESGWWFTPAQPGSRRYFKVGSTMPSLGGDYGDTFWQWSPDQGAPKL